MANRHLSSLKIMRLQSAANISIETLRLARTQEDQHECTAAQRAAQKEPDASHVQLCMSVSKYNLNTIDSRLWIFSYLTCTQMTFMWNSTKVPDYWCDTNRTSTKSFLFQKQP